MFRNWKYPESKNVGLLNNKIFYFLEARGFFCQPILEDVEKAHMRLKHNLLPQSGEMLLDVAYGTQQRMHLFTLFIHNLPIFLYDSTCLLCSGRSLEIRTSGEIPQLRFFPSEPI